MKRTLAAAAGFALFAATGLANAASWSVVVQPGVYGRVEIGGYVEAPQVYDDRPVIAVDDGDGDVVEEVVDTAYATALPPVYLWVPEYQRMHWARYCRDYDAVGVPVYFVDDRWYRDNVMRRHWTTQQRSWNQGQWIEADRIARERFERQRFEQQRGEQARWNHAGAWQDPQRDQHDRWDHAHRDRDSAAGEGQDRVRWGATRGDVPQAQPPRNGWEQARRDWQGQGGQQTGWQQGNRGNAGPVQAQQPARAPVPQWSDHANAHGAPIQNVVYRRNDRLGQFEHGRDGRHDR